MMEGKNEKNQNCENPEECQSNGDDQKNDDEKFLLDEAAGFSPSSRIPPFWKTDPVLWFETTENIFSTSKVTKSEMKFQITVASLSYDVIDKVANVVRSPPSEGPYEALKERLITTFAEPENQKISRILKERELGESEKPSMFLKALRELAGPKCCPELLRSVWIAGLPDRMQSAISVITENDLTKLAEIADRIAEIYELPALPAPKVHHSRHVTTKSSRECLKRKNGLEEAIEKLTIEINELKAQLSVGNSQNTPPCPPRPRIKDIFKNFCFYHQTYRHQARNCRPPCDWNNYFLRRNNNKN